MSVGGRNTSSPQQYCLRWNNYQNNLTNVFDQLLQSEAFVDVTLASDGESLKAHKMILSACSPYFQQLFFDNPCSHPIVILKDVKWEELKAVVEFMYRGEINVSQEQLAPLLKVAELLKIRGLADVSRGSSADFVAAAAAASTSSTGAHKLLPSTLAAACASSSASLPMQGFGGSGGSGCGSAPGTPLPTGTPSSMLHPSLFLHASPQLPESDGEGASPQPASARLEALQQQLQLHQRQHASPSSASSLQRQLLQQQLQFNSHRPTSAHSAYANGHHLNNSGGGGHTRGGRKRRRFSATMSDDNVSLSPSDTLDEDQLEIDYDSPSPAMMSSLLEAGLLGNIASTVGNGSSGGQCSNFVPPSGGSRSAVTGAGPPGAARGTPASSSSSSLNSLAAAAGTGAGAGAGPSSLLNFHNAAIAAAAVAAAGNNNTHSSHSLGVGGGGGGSGSSSSPAINDMDLKPGIREMIREEERAKMLESSHGWLGPSGASALSDSYQYQIQSLWQKCWSTNQSGMVQALRFRERGPLKSWKPETMADAIFAVLREGLSLSQAARKYDIPYPTFVLYSNRVHNMLGPSNDGSSDMRPKGRGRPQRILLGSWPEDHIHAVIRAVVFRDASKDDLPFGFPRELCMPPQPGSSQGHGHGHGHGHGMNNGLDMSLHAPFLAAGLQGSIPSGSRRDGGTVANLYGSTNDNMNLSAFKVHANLGVGGGNRSRASGSESHSPLLDELVRAGGGVSGNMADLDLIREEREQAILRAMKKSGDDDPELDREPDDLDEDESELVKERLIAEMVTRRRNSVDGSSTNRNAGTSTSRNGRNAVSIDRILINSKSRAAAAVGGSASICDSDPAPELVQIKKEIIDEGNDLIADGDGDECNSAMEEDGLFISEAEPGMEADHSNAVDTQNEEQIQSLVQESDSSQGRDPDDPDCLVIVEGENENNNVNDDTGKLDETITLISDPSSESDQTHDPDGRTPTFPSALQNCSSDPTTS